MITLACCCRRPFVRERERERGGRVETARYQWRDLSNHSLPQVKSGRRSVAPLHTFQIEPQMASTLDELITKADVRTDALLNTHSFTPSLTVVNSRTNHSLSVFVSSSSRVCLCVCVCVCVYPFVHVSCTCCWVLTTLSLLLHCSPAPSARPKRPPDGRWIRGPQPRNLPKSTAKPFFPSSPTPPTPTSPSSSATPTTTSSAPCRRRRPPPRNRHQRRRRGSEWRPTRLSWSRAAGTSPPASCRACGSRGRARCRLWRHPRRCGSCCGSCTAALCPKWTKTWRWRSWTWRGCSTSPPFQKFAPTSFSGPFHRQPPGCC